MANESDLEQRGRRALEKYFSESGIAVRWLRSQSREGWRPDAELDLALPNGERRRCIVEFQSNARRLPIEHALLQLRNQLLRSSQIAPVSSSWRDLSRIAQPVVVAEHLGRPMRDWLRREGVWFGDLSGNRFFSAPGLLVDREVAEKSGKSREPAPSVFADRNSRLLRYLFLRGRQEIGVRELAGKLGISASSVSNGLKKLEEMSYLERKSGDIRLLAREDLLEEWVSFYRPRFRRQVESRYYVHARSAEAVVEKIRSSPLARNPGYALGLHAGASLVAPFVQFQEAHAYVPPESGSLEQRLVAALGAKPAEAEANLVFLEPFYKHSVLFEARDVKGVRVVSDLQLYLDLMCYPRRGKEQAEVVLERRLRPAWSKS